MHDLVDNAECPGCGARSTLDPEHGYPNARSCGACAGWFLERDTAYRFLVVELGHSSDEIAGLLALPGARKRRCPACDRDMSAISLHRQDIDVCPSCGGAWLPPGAMATMSGGAHGASRSSSARPRTTTQPPTPFGPPASTRPANPFGPPPASTSGPSAAAPHEPPRVVTTPLSAGAPGAAAGAELELARPARAKPKPSPSSSPDPPEPSAPVDSGPSPRARRVLHVGKSAPSASSSRSADFEAAPQGTGSGGASRIQVALGAGALVLLLGGGVAALALTRGEPDDDAPTDAQPVDDGTQKYAAYLRHYRFGGRDVDWWSARLTELAPAGAAPDEKAFAITKARAERLGLVVNQRPGRVEVTLSEPLTARLLERLEVE